jgi:ribose transport system ATP-binding protein
MRRASIIPAEPDRQLSTFSGGNQQKLLFSKWFRLNPIILILDEPTQGVDVGAVHDLYQLIRHGAEDGAAVLLLSSEWDDLARICHRVLILDRGRNVKELRGRELTADNIAKAVLSRNAARSA